MTSSPNIVFIVIDALRAQNLGCYGSERKISPNIDRLANESILFSDAYTTITKTDPALTTIFSGRYPLSHGLIQHGTRVKKKGIDQLRKIKFLPEILKLHDYRTLAVDWLDRWHARGYDFYSGPLTEFDIPFRRTWCARRVVDRIFTRIFGFELLELAIYKLTGNRPISYDPADIVTNKAIDLVKQSKNEGFFLFIHYWDPHAIYFPPEEYSKSIFLEDRYNGEIRFVDHQLGRLMSFIKGQSLWEDTLFILTSDHGESIQEHGIIMAHEGLYETTVRVPLILRHSKFPPRKIKGFVQHVDIVPTVLDLLGISVDQHFDGLSLVPLLTGKRKSVRQTVYFEDLKVRRLWSSWRSERSRGIRTKKYKYIQVFGREALDSLDIKAECPLKREMLFDLEVDPKEENNIINRKPKKAKKLSLELTSISETLSKNCD